MRRVRPYALHWVCQVCDFLFFVLSGDEVKAERFKKTLENGDLLFEVMGGVTIPPGRTGVSRLRNSPSRPVSMESRGRLGKIEED